VQSVLGVSERRACRRLGQPGSTQLEARAVSADEAALTEAVVSLATEYGHYGYRRITAQLRVEGWRMNAKRVEGLEPRLPTAARGAEGAASAAEAGEAGRSDGLLRFAAALAGVAMPAPDTLQQCTVCLRPLRTG
jgi:transposase InsO family protein